MTASPKARRSTSRSALKLIAPEVEHEAHFVFMAWSWIRAGLTPIWLAQARAYSLNSALPRHVSTLRPEAMLTPVISASFSRARQLGPCDDSWIRGAEESC